MLMHAEMLKLPCRDLLSLKLNKARLKKNRVYMYIDEL